MPLKCKPAQSYNPTTSFIRLSHSVPLFTCPNNARARYQTASNVPRHENLLKWFKLASPKAAYPVSPIPSYRNHKKGYYSLFPKLILTHDQPWCFPMCPFPKRGRGRHGMFPPLGTYEYNNLSSQRQLSPDPLASSYLKNNETYSFKQLGGVLFHHLAHQPGLVHVAARFQDQQEQAPLHTYSSSLCLIIDQSQAHCHAQGPVRGMDTGWGVAAGSHCRLGSYLQSTEQAFQEISNYYLWLK